MSNDNNVIKQIEFTANVKLSETARKIRSMRLRKNLTIEQVAEKTGIDASVIFEFETDKASPTDGEIDKLLEVLI